MEKIAKLLPKWQQISTDLPKRRWNAAPTYRIIETVQDRFFACPAGLFFDCFKSSRILFPSAGYELVQHLRRCGVRRADLVCVDRDRGLRIGVSEPFGDRFHVYAVCDHQRGVCVPQRMQMDRRQVVSPHKSAEPGRNAVRVKGFTELVCKYVSHTMIKVAVSQTCFLFNLQRRGCTVLSDDTVQFSASKVFNASSRSVQFHAPYSFGRKQAKNKKPFP